MRELTVTRTWLIKSGQGTKGPWALYGVEALDADGNTIPHQLKSFTNIPLGPVTVEVEVQQHEQYGISYLLKLPRNGGARPPAAAGDALLGRIERLESEVRRLSSVVDRREPDGGLYNDGHPRAPRQSAGIPDDDIPF